MGSSSSRKFDGMQQHARQGVAVALAAGEHADPLEHVVFGEQKAAQQAAQFGVAWRAAPPCPDRPACAHSGSSSLY